ncbi:unnamed protein product [Spirodela intermedia]|uniref:Uncharacterized protein n=1 Tax=Spirodela intermedia TaxID=51605 RepID=A0A7I8KDN1_SPIIN|nr:unnamed protein product [Spirodela intermedia]
MRNPSPAAASGSWSEAPASGKPKVLAGRAQVGLKRGPWTPEEDALLSSFVRREGEGKWRTLPRRAGLLRCGKSCRLRWMNYLRPSVKRGQIAPDEEDLILRLHRLLGNRWSLIAGRLPGRTDNEIKNYWNTHLSKKLISQGIDPRTHKPLNTDNPSTSFQKDHAPAPPAPSVYPNPNPNPKPLTRFQNGGGLNSTLHIREDACEFFDGADLNQRSAWQNFDDSSSGRALTNQYVENDIEYCSDDLFASFFNSLISDDVFQQDPQNDLVSPPDPLASGGHGFGNQAFWEPASVAYSTTFIDKNYNAQPTDDDLGKQL